jgi:hypothetical protein
MMDMHALTMLLGWCAVINIAVLLVSTIALVAVRGPVSNIHSKLFGVSQSDLAPLYMQYLGNYKIAIIILNIVPYLALKIMA